MMPSLFEGMPQLEKVCVALLLMPFKMEKFDAAF